MSSPGLTFAGVTSPGNKALITGDAGENGDVVGADLGHVGGSTNTAWSAFLLKELSGGSAPNGDTVCGYGPSGTTSGPGVGMIFNRNVYGIDNTGLAGSVALTTVAVSTATTLFVVKFDFAAGMEYLWLNPSTTSEPSTAQANASLAMTSSFRSGGINQVILAADLTPPCSIMM